MTQDRFWVLFLIAAIGAMWIGADRSMAQENKTRRPSIVFIMGDDHTSQLWSCYGGRLANYAQTPNIDRIAREGALLQNCFCTNSICVPSRATILTGQYSHRNGVRTLAESLDPASDTFVKHLHAAGYRTALVGKWHLKSVPQGFDYWNVIRGQGTYDSPTMFENGFDHPREHPGAYSTDLFTDIAIDWMKRELTADDKHPFCLLLHFKACHEPFRYHPRFADLNKDRELPLPKDLLGPTGPEHSRIPGWPLETLAARFRKNPKGYGDGPLQPVDHDADELRRRTAQKLTKDMIRCGAGIDENIGRVVDFLRGQNLLDQTVLIYTSDQGYFLGEHNYFDKRFAYEESMRMPFVIRYPVEIKSNRSLGNLILNTDFAPLLLDYAGLEIPKAMQGRSFRHLLKGESDPGWRDRVYYRYYENTPERPAHLGVRTERYKLIYFDGMEGPDDRRRWELYDLETDPLEQANIYDSASEELIDSLKSQLALAQAEAGDHKGP